nr:protein multipolar spindle 1 isoform X2 [Tanacetum cinerariifolium]
MTSSQPQPPSQTTATTTAGAGDGMHNEMLTGVRLKERRKRRGEGSARRLYLSENNDEVTEQLRASVDFLVDLCETISNPDDANFANWSHQAVDFILDSIKNITSHGKITESVEGIIGTLSLRLVRKMCTTLQGDGAGQVHSDTQFHVQHLLRKLGSEPCMGQRVILAVSQRISLLAENLLFLDPFESTFPEIHSSLYI